MGSRLLLGWFGSDRVNASPSTEAAVSGLRRPDTLSVTPCVADGILGATQVRTAGVLIERVDASRRLAYLPTVRSLNRLLSETAALSYTCVAPFKLRHPVDRAGSSRRRHHRADTAVHRKTGTISHPFISVVPPRAHRAICSTSCLSDADRCLQFRCCDQFTSSGGDAEPAVTTCIAIAVCVVGIGVAAQDCAASVAIDAEQPIIQRGARHHHF